MILLMHFLSEEQGNTCSYAHVALTLEFLAFGTIWEYVQVMPVPLIRNSLNDYLYN